MKNLIVNFVDWYLESKHAKEESHYFSTREDGLALLSECAAEFAMAYGYNPFIVEKENIRSFSSKLKADLEKEGNSFYAFSKKRGNHMPRAILGKNNYLQFFDELGEKKKNSELLKQPILKKQLDSIGHYDQKEIRKNFYFRLITQDRYYEFLCFPISVLKKLFYKYDKKPFIDKWVNNQIDNIVVHISKTETITFKDIKTLDIKADRTVLINDKFKLHTIVAGTDEIEELRTNTLQDIVIDHVKPFSNILFELKEQLLTLQVIHNVLENINDGRISNKEDLTKAGNDLVSNVEFNHQEINSLEKDLDLIFSKIQLQLMDKYQNLYKKKYSE